MLRAPRYVAFAAMISAGCASTPVSETGGGGQEADPKAGANKTDLSAKIAQFAPAELTADISGLPESEKKALMKIVEASKLLDPIFDRQAWQKNPELMATLEKDSSPEGQQKLAYFKIMRGPWDRQDDHQAPSRSTSRGRQGSAASTPRTTTAERELDAYLKKNPKQGRSRLLESLFTVVQAATERTSWRSPTSQALRAVAASPPRSKLLKEAAKLTKDATLQASS